MRGTVLADSAGAGAAAVVVVILVIALYFLPTIVAAVRRVPNVGSVAVINFFFGWSIVGWVIALSMAARSSANSTVVNVHAGVNNLVQPQYPPQQYPAQYGWPQHGGATAYGAQRPDAQSIDRSNDTRAIGQQGQADIPANYAAAWYPDPYGTAARRYWDGQRWTEHTA